MEYHEVKLLLDLPAIRLFRASNAVMVLGFLFRTFKKDYRVAIPEGQLRAALDVYLEERRESDPLSYPQNAADYLADWCSESHGFLRRYYGTGTDEPLYELTNGSEKALLWLESLREARFVGTESRLESIFSGLEEILKFSSDDPEQRVNDLRNEADKIQAEIDRIRATGRVDTFTPVQINERYARILLTARELLADFRQVEDNFKRIAHEIAEQQSRPGVTKGAIVGHMLDSHDALRASEQGQSFFAFWELLLSPDRQTKFQDDAGKIASLDLLDEENRRSTMLRYLISNLLREGEKVNDSHQRMSSSLRRVLDTTHLAERRRVGELLREIRNAALSVRAHPPDDDTFFEVEDFPDIFTTMSRPLWQNPDSTASSGVAEAEDDKIGLDDLRRFCNLPQIRLQELRRRVDTCLAYDKFATLQEVLDAFPPRQGMMEILGYLIVATGDPTHFVGDEFDTITLPPPDARRWNVPRVLFRKQ